MTAHQARAQRGQSCDPRRCPIARTLLLAGRWADVREILPSDDRHASRAMFAGGAA